MMISEHDLRAVVSADVAQRTLESVARAYGVPGSTLARFLAGSCRAGTVALIRERQGALAISTNPELMA